MRPEHRGCVATIGSFDGIHLGHQAILKQLRERADQLGLPSAVVIFEPQPREYFLVHAQSGQPDDRALPDKIPARLMRLREKVTALFAEGVDCVCCLQFNARLRGFTAQQFVQQILVNGLGVRSLIIGDDFRFGCDRSGDFAMLQRAGQQHGFSVQDTATVSCDGERISSTRVRRELDQGNFAGAAALLGRPYTISGVVVQGQQLGRKLGVPTANVHLYRYRAPLSGVFAVQVSINDRLVNGVANVGVRPTVAQNIKPLLEVHLFGWDKEIYGQRIAVEFQHKIREEKKFASLELLKTAIENDIKQARAFFSQG